MRTNVLDVACVLKCVPMLCLSARTGKPSSRLAMHVWNAVHALETVQV